MTNAYPRKKAHLHKSRSRQSRGKDHRQTERPPTEAEVALAKLCNPTKSSLAKKERK
jgi:hypothetical protein